MEAFLFYVAKDIINKYSNLDKVCIIFPNKRTGMFFRKYFGQVAGKTSWSPNIYTIEQTIRRFTGILQPDKLTLLFELYLIFNQVFKNEENPFPSFDKFFQVGETILGDFNELDNYLVPVKQIFQNIKQLSEIDLAYDFLPEEQKLAILEFWKNFSPERNSTEKQRFFKIWEKIPEVYDLFTKELLKKKIGYKGLINFNLCDLIKNGDLKHEHFNMYLLVGFNALTQSEKELFNYLYKINKAKFYWDVDEYYIADIKQEAGFFMRDNIKLFPNEYKYGTSQISNRRKTIRLIGVPMEVGQAKAIPTLIEDLKLDEKKRTETGIILANENLLFPVLHSIPPDVDKINVTMGYPLTDTPLYSLLELYLKNQIYLRPSKSTTNKFYHEDVISILRHPYIWKFNHEICKKIIESVHSRNMVFVSSAHIMEFQDPLLSLIFMPVTEKNDWESIFINLMNILFVLFEKTDFASDQTPPIENEYIYHVYTEIKRLRDVFLHQSAGIEISTEMAIRLLRQILRQIRIPFSGEHSEGLQVMGIMETRNLDFENIIFLGFNEGIIPSTSISKSFIPQNLRLAFGLPVVKFQDSIYAYLFYRLLQRANNVILLYNNISASGSGELSRFAHQLIYESGLPIIHQQFKQDLLPASSSKIVVEKNKVILDILESYISTDKAPSRFFSASALNSYLDCSLMFYFRYIAQIKEEESVNEELSPQMFGEILHQAMENIYKNHIKTTKRKEVTKDDFKQLFLSVEESIDFAFKNHFGKNSGTDSVFEGTNLIIREVINKYIDIILKYDQNYAPFSIEELENPAGYEGYIQFESNGTEKKAGIRGIIDRIDCKDGVFRILDYKTGSVDKSFKEIEFLFDRNNDNRQKAVFQTFLYGWIFLEKNSRSLKKIFPGIFDIREMNSDSFKPNLIQKVDRTSTVVDHTNFSDYLPEFEQNLKLLFSEIFQIDVPFKQTMDIYHCEYCTYRWICGR